MARTVRTPVPITASPTQQPDFEVEIADAPEFRQECRNTFSQAHPMTGGDESIYYATHFSNYVRTAVPGMNTTDMHMWMSASKTTTSPLTHLLEQDGLFSYDDPVVTHAPELAGTAT